MVDKNTLAQCGEEIARRGTPEFAPQITFPLGSGTR
jgi:hypothetical protein